MREVGAVLVWDLDGTLYRSAAACLHYAHGIAETLEQDAREPYVAAVEQYLAGAGGVEASDGWEAAVMLAGGSRGASRAYGDAFARTREFMLSDACDLEVPDGLRELLERVGDRARRVLVTNTPSFGVMPLLERLDLMSSFDEISCDSAKPNRFDIRLRAFADVNGVGPQNVLSIGDHFVNDIQPALNANCAAAYVDPFGVGPTGRAQLEAPRFEDLLEPIETWVKDR
jgi:phosphoglycolate phosphatase-like HAD superfamily hydrolase